jgi:hypothetical protein
MYRVLISRTFLKQFSRLPIETQERIRLSLSRDWVTILIVAVRVPT